MRSLTRNDLGCTYNNNNNDKETYRNHIKS